MINIYCDFEGRRNKLTKDQENPISTGYTNEPEIKEINDGDYFFAEDDQLWNPVDAHHDNQNSEVERLSKGQIEVESKPQIQALITSKRPVAQKNSNSIKKIGRIILDHIDDFSNNSGVKRMLDDLENTFLKTKREKDKRDRFNLNHLKMIFHMEDPQKSSENLKRTRILLIKRLRKSILHSNQMSQDNKILYLKTLKASTLRCQNKYLGSRLEIPEE